MKQFMNNHIQIAAILLVGAVAIMAGAYTAKSRQEAVEKQVRSNIEAQEERMFTLAELTDRNGADDSVGEIIADCAKRVEYESLLVQLGELSKKDLVTLQNLFDLCGHFDAERKSLMVAKLEREFQGYEESLALLDILQNEKTLEYPHEAWKDLVTQERVRSTLLSDLSDLQEKIIGELLGGGSVYSARVSELVEEAQNIGQLLIVADKNIDARREEVKP